LINCANTVVRLEIETNKVVGTLEHSAVYGFTVKLAGGYDLQLLARWNESTFYKKLKQVLPDSKDQELWLDYFASALSINSTFHNWLFCIGDGLNGKSMMLKAMHDA